MSYTTTLTLTAPMINLIPLLMLILTLTGCAEPSNKHRAVYLLMDTSGTYTQELNKAQLIMNYLLATLDTGDSIAIARIDSGSFSEKDIVVKATFDERPSTVINQKKVLKQKLDNFIAQKTLASRHTDISGGLLQAAEYLYETGASEKHILVFSDLEEDLAKGHIRDFDLPLNSIKVSALNVTKLSGDNIDPREYLARLDYWKKKVEKGGGQWQVVNDLERLDAFVLKI